MCGSTTCHGRHAAYQDNWPADPPSPSPSREKMISHQFETFTTTESNLCDLARISMHCLFTVHPETYLEPTALDTYPNFRIFFEGSWPHRPCPQG